MEKYVIDTHALLWHATADTRIGTNAKAIIERCEAGEIQIIVPAIVLIEAVSTIRNPKKGFNNYNPNTLFDWLNNSVQFLISNLDIELAVHFNNNLDDLRTLHDDHDRIIVVTSRIFDNVPIITRAGDIQSIASTIW